LPLPGKLPDMKAQSKVYIKLQNIYKAKARKDAAEILEIAQAAPGGERVDPAEVDLFCKNAAFVKLINATGRGGGSSDAKINRADRLKSAAGKHSAPSFHILSCSIGSVCGRSRPFWGGRHATRVLPRLQTG
jgi:amyloid beta precursor protein binding protein 1